MTALDSADLLTPDRDDLGRQALAHFEREADFLDSLCEQLQHIHAALLDNDQAALHAVVQRRAEFERAQEDLRRERAGLCRRAGALLGVAAEEVHLSRLAEYLGGESGRRLACLHQRLGERLREAGQVRARIETLAHGCLSFLQRFFLDLTGGDDGRYSRTGSRSDSACGVFIEVRG